MMFMRLNEQILEMQYVMVFGVKMEAAGSSKILVYNHVITKCHDPEDHNIYHHHENLKSCKFYKHLLFISKNCYHPICFPEY